MSRDRAGFRRGEASVETVLVFPVLLGVVLVLVQLAVTMHTAHVAGVVAMRGAQTAARMAGHPAAVPTAVDEMDSTIRDLQGRPADSLALRFDDLSVRSTVVLRTGVVVPWLATRVERSASIPLEVFRFSGER